MLFSFRSSDARKYPRLLSVQSLELPVTEKVLARMLKQGHARYDESTGDLEIFEFKTPRVYLCGSASEWPDVIGSECFREHPIMVSQRVVTALQQHGITGCAPRAVEIRKRATRKLHVRNAPQYYFLEVTGRIAIHVPSCTSASAVAPDVEEKLRAAWDGSDVFTEKPSEVGTWAVYCSEKVLDLARSEKWTNCGFQPLHYFAPNVSFYLLHESPLSVPQMIERYVRRLK